MYLTGQYSQTLHGRCQTCGFLSKHAVPGFKSLPTPTFYEIEMVERYFGLVFKHVPDLSVGEVPTEPACFVSAIPRFYDAMSPYLERGDPLEDAAKHAFLEDRHCKEWFPYTQGRSPKEHLEELKMLQLEQRRQEFEERMEKDRRDFESKLDELNREERRRTDNVMKWLAFAGIVFSVVQAMVALFAIVFAVVQVVLALLGISADSWILGFFR
jgi:hypothetical protein